MFRQESKGGDNVLSPQTGALTTSWFDMVAKDLLECSCEEWVMKGDRGSTDERATTTQETEASERNVTPRSSQGTVYGGYGFVVAGYWRCLLSLFRWMDLPLLEL